MKNDAWEKIEQLYHAARELEGDARAAYLNEACGTDTSLRMQVERLLEEQPDSNSLFARPAAEFAARVLLQSTSTVAGASSKHMSGHFGEYSIRSLIGVGGMGEVYRASDTRLGRDVAIKVLPPAFTIDPESLARFEREARILASLNHPNIGAIYELEESEGFRALVLELVEGPTLADRLQGGPITAGEALGVARQVADALDAAHSSGIVHRDLKPANIKVRPDGTVKVLDFGIAKASIGDAPGADLTKVDSTGQGVILGTPTYMSPEQVRGQSVDRRADIWAFGCVLYEMLAGHRAFSGATSTELFAAILEREPDWRMLPASVPPSVTRLVRRCLEKDPRQRLRDIGDARLELSEQADGGVISTPVAAPQRSWWRAALLAAAVAAISIVAAAITAGIVWTLRPQPTAVVSHFTFFLPEGQTLTRGGRPAVAISPDGKNIVYQANFQLYLRPLSDVDSRPIDGTNEDVGDLFFSPDGLWIGFYSVRDRKLKKISITGGVAVPIAETEFPFGASWTVDDQILYASEQRGKGIFRVSANGGTPEGIVTAKPDEFMSGPQLLPDGEHVLYTVTTNTAAAGIDRWDKGQIAIESLKSHVRKTLIEGSAGRYLPTGHIVYAIGTTLFAIGFDAAKLRMVGGKVSVLEDVHRNLLAAAAQFDVAGNGSMIYLLSREVEGANKLALVDRSGKSEELPPPPGRYTDPRVSRDGKQIAFGSMGSVWIYDLSDRAAPRKLPFDHIAHPLWTFDGLRVIFKSIPAEGTMFWQTADGNTAAEPLDKSPAVGPGAVSPDGRTLVFGVGAPGGGDIWMMPLAGDHTRKPLISDPGVQDQPAFSPDGHWIVYRSQEASNQPSQIYAQPYPPVPGVKYQLTTTTPGGSFFPLWSRDSKQIFYLQYETVGRMQLFAIDVRTEPAFAVGNPTQLPIPKILTEGGTLRPYDVTPDGRFLIVTRGAQASGKPRQLELRITLNWFEELKQRVPVPW